jgi:hypothetical protein
MSGKHTQHYTAVILHDYEVAYTKFQILSFTWHYFDTQVNTLNITLQW